MNTTLRRSPRLSQQYSTSAVSPTFPSFSTSASVSTTSQPSPTTDPASIAAQQDQLRLQLETQFLVPPFHSAAPLPSPSASDSSPFFGTGQPRSPYDMPEQGQTSQSTGHQNQVAQGTMQGLQSSTSQHHNSFSSGANASMTHSVQSQQQGPPPGILAEAAKRAQMACLMRDLGDVTL